MLKTTIIGQLQDNYAYMLSNEQGDCLVIDPSDGGPIQRELRAQGLRLKYILNTHHHDDHTHANLPLKEQEGAEVYANQTDFDRIPGVDVGIAADTALSLLGTRLEVLGSPGHTLSHLLFYMPNEKCLFTGDTLFLLGCGKLFEGSAADMYKNLQRIRALPGDCKLYCGHEYTLKNASFAEHVLGADDEKLRPIAARYREQRAGGEPTMPGILADELSASPYFRCDEAKVKRNLGLRESASEVETFAALRRLRDTY